MAIPVLLILAVLWAAFFVWPLVRGRSVDRQVDSVGDFSYRLGVIGRTGGHTARRRRAPVAMAPAMPTFGGPPSAAARRATTARTRRRRRDVLVALAVAVVGTLLLAVLLGGAVAWVVHLVVDVLLVAYVVALVRMRHAATEQRAKVRYLPHSSPAAAPVMALRRTGSS